MQIEKNSESLCRSNKCGVGARGISILCTALLYSNVQKHCGSSQSRIGLTAPKYRKQHIYLKWGDSSQMVSVNAGQAFSYF
jgi:hypothetical protein